MSAEARIAPALLLLALAAAGAAHAEEVPDPRDASGAKGGDYSIAWSTHDGGGGRSTGGTYVLSGSIAQADADPLQPASAGPYQLSGGWWGGATPSGPPDFLFGDGFE